MMTDKKPQLNSEEYKTTGHEWDGITEYDSPDPFWLRLLFYIMLFFSLGYWLLYPSWPTPNSEGFLNWSSAKQLQESLAEIEAVRADYQAEFDKASFEEIFKNQELMKFAIAGGQSAFQTNCAACHGNGGRGNTGYPNLTTGAWLWGGKVDDIYTTLKYGIRSGHDETRDSQMAAFGRDGILTAEEVNTVADYVMTLATGRSEGSAGDIKINTIFEKICGGEHRQMREYFFEY
jgi:cytochrome c oxidase cbb3-type subunit 3